MPAERLSSLDASFLYLETPALHMHVAGLSIFAPREDGPLTYDHVQRVVEARIHLAPRLRQRALPVPGNLGRPVWVDDDRFDLDFHLRRSAVPSPGGRHQLERSVGRVLSRPLDRSKPLWELYVFEGLDEGRTAVLLKLHHALAEGTLATGADPASRGSGPRRGRGDGVPSCGSARANGPRSQTGDRHGRAHDVRRDGPRRHGSSSAGSVRRSYRARATLRDRRCAVRAAPSDQALP